MGAVHPGFSQPHADPQLHPDGQPDPKCVAIYDHHAAGLAHGDFQSAADPDSAANGHPNTNYHGLSTASRGESNPNRDRRSLSVKSR